MVDSIEFARQGEKLSGTVAVSSLQRLAEVVFDTGGDLRYWLDGFVDSDSRPSLQLRVEGTITLTCQRCLSALPVEMCTERCFHLVGNETGTEGLAEEPDNVETLVADAKLDVLTLVEDEILLQIPIAPVHNEGTCSRPTWRGEDIDAGSPFAALDALKRGKD